MTGFQATALAIRGQWGWPPHQQAGWRSLGAGAKLDEDAPVLPSGCWGLGGGNCLKSHSEVL